MRGSEEGPPRTEAAVPLHRRLRGGSDVSRSGGALFLSLCRRAQLVFLARALALDAAIAVGRTGYGRGRDFLGLEAGHDFARQSQVLALFNQAPVGFAGGRDKAHGQAAFAGAADGNGGVKGKRPSKKDKLRAAAQAETDGQQDES